MDQTNLRRKDTTKGPPIRVLSLDGGGVRGYSMLIILQELMHRVYVETHGKPPSRDATPKPCDYFDLIGGTGTGGLIAIMLGRLRMDLETCMDVYVKMTRKVFETDKTFAGIPYKHTLFKASKLEEAIKLCVREHTIFEDEGNDGTATGGREFQDLTSPASVTSTAAMRRSMSVRSSGSVSSPTTIRNSTVSPSFPAWGNANASLYDGRENRTKTAVTAVYQGTNPRTGSSILLRSYDSRKEPPPEFNCTIWQAGRATCAVGLAFKPIQIGQSIFIDEGAGKYNPAEQLLEEAAVNEWPGREVGVFVSVGTGKRPANSAPQHHEWWEDFLGGTMGAFAEARRRLLSKMEDCETVHQEMLKTGLAKRGVDANNYYRLNVDVGLAELVAMNEWSELNVVTTNTRKYLKESNTQKMLVDAAVKMAKIELMKRRQDQRTDAHSRESSWSYRQPNLPSTPPVHPGAVELPAEDTIQQTPPQHYRRPGNPPYPDDASFSSSQDKFVLVPGETTPPRVSADLPYRSRDDKIAYQPPPQPSTYNSSEPPPRPPKTPINEPGYPAHHPQHAPSARLNGAPRPPYPDYGDGPPPIVSKLRKPEYTPR
ncbi:uncharacterized protein Z518_01741 [Rhinocladiella mackenziei CBS 650.93]|uniref:Rhinocladiella mackenziei CBS 650.93 unplaced genomic scaffold supercont1.1, whole genome shotgun sequence n=1 Tax=Rhinocladiella mackenziei CBS 650.93 TaxID=1442369 RepID=A0A0D2G6R5_9EURO|nr:uncharacterized protein Z518_01741 [Rhinocladiella mackenziei CBS 650.93]KIX10657.1 hypothetical protein Z518_01741 [Rhinocladiella mackenziei CBS 650.93]